MPPIPGIRTSSTRQSALSSWFETKNPSAEANAFTANPTDLSNPQRASRTDSSSSTIEIRRGAATQENDLDCGKDPLYLGMNTGRARLSEIAAIGREIGRGPNSRQYRGL